MKHYHFNPPPSGPDWHVEWFGQLAIVTDLERRIIAVALVHRDEVVLADSSVPAPRVLKPCGTVAAYRRGCRCADCRAALAANERELYARRRAA